MASAQDTFAEMIKLGVRPRLKALGFTGSGTTFVWPSTACFCQLGIQRSQFSNRDALKFTINVTAADRTAWELARQSKPFFPAKPSPNTFYGSDFWQSRIGKLLPGGEDKWWTVEANQDWRLLADEVVDAVTCFALPELRQRGGA
jgi:hypothetical protein